MSFLRGSKNKETTTKEDLIRHEEQQALVKEIVAKFEEPTYIDANPADREYIVDRMQKVSKENLIVCLEAPRALLTDTLSRCKQPALHHPIW